MSDYPDDWPGFAESENMLTEPVPQPTELRERILAEAWTRFPEGLPAVFVHDAVAIAEAHTKEAVAAERATWDQHAKEGWDLANSRTREVVGLRAELASLRADLEARDERLNQIRQLVTDTEARLQFDVGPVVRVALEPLLALLETILEEPETT